MLRLPSLKRRMLLWQRIELQIVVSFSFTSTPLPRRHFIMVSSQSQSFLSSFRLYFHRISVKSSTYHTPRPSPGLSVPCSHPNGSLCAMVSGTDSRILSCCRPSVVSTSDKLYGRTFGRADVQIGDFQSRCMSNVGRFETIAAARFESIEWPILVKEAFRPLSSLSHYR